MTKEELIELAQVGMGIHSPDDPEYVVCKALIKALEEQRTWVKLTDEQFLEACKIAEGGNYMVAFQRIQQWLMENNT